MHKGLIALLWVSAGSISVSSAVEQKQFDIEKDDSGKVFVSCEYAAKTPPEYLQKMIGGPYTVENEKGEECPPELMVLKTKGLIIGVPGTPIPIGPRCKCPETYEVKLKLRWMSIYQHELERGKQELLKQYGKVEAILDQRNLKHLLNQSEFGSLNRLR